MLVKTMIMKNRLVLLLFVSFTMIFTSCDPFYQLEFIVNNQTDNDITIVSYPFFQPERDSSRFSSGNQLVVFVAEGIGQLPEDAYEAVTELPFDSLIIKNADGELFTKNQMDLNNWTGEFRKDTDIGVFTLTITDDDFN